MNKQEGGNNIGETVPHGLMYDIGRIAAEVFKLWKSPAFKGVRQVSMAIKVAEVSKWSIQRSLEHTKTYSDRAILDVLKGFSCKVDGGIVSFEIPEQNTKGEFNMKTNVCSFNINGEKGEYTLHQNIAEYSPIFFSQLGQVDKQSYNLFKKKDPIEGNDYLVPFSFEDEKDLSMAHMEYLAHIRAISPSPNAEYIRIISILLTKLPSEIKNVVLNNRHRFVHEQLITMNYHGLLQGQATPGISNLDLDTLVMSMEFFADRFYKKR